MKTAQLEGFSSTSNIQTRSGKKKKRPNLSKKPKAMKDIKHQYVNL